MQMARWPAIEPWCQLCGKTQAGQCSAALCGTSCSSQTYVFGLSAVYRQQALGELRDVCPAPGRGEAGAVGDSQQAGSKMPPSACES